MEFSRNLIRIWVAKYEAGEFSDDHQTADLLQQYEGRIAALGRLVGQLVLEDELLRKAHSRSQRISVASSSMITGPRGCPSDEGVS